MITNATRRTTPDLIAVRETFRNAGDTMRASWNGWGRGRLPRWATVPDNAYVVYSYATPIGWFDLATGRWTVPAVKYSVTTSRHQHLLRAGIALLGEYADYLTPDA